MRPQVAGDGLQQPNKHLHADREGVTTVNTSDARPTTFFMTREEDLDKREGSSDELGSELNYGVQSLADTIGGISDEPAVEDKEKQAGKRHASPKKGTSGQEMSVSSASHSDAGGSVHHSPAHPLARRSPPLVTQSMTPLSSVSPFPGSSLPSSPKSTSSKSFRPSDEDSMDETGSQAIVSSPEEGHAETLAALEGSMPQLIMPSLKMPSRRPFTERGRSIGRVKILLAGDSGVGKTSLIKSILQTCEDIVHVDPLSSNSPSLETLPPRKARRKSAASSSNSTTAITEIYASTRPYPSWWSNFEENKVLKRRKSMGDTVLERNLCFVDTPGISTRENMESILQYIDSQAARALDLNKMDNGDLMSLVAGNGGSQVDVVFYLFSKEHTRQDLAFLLELRHSTNIIPILNKSDKMTDAQLESLQQSLKTELEEQGLKPFSLTLDSPGDVKVYTTCSAPARDDDAMDASLLVSPDYVQPLLPSELTLLLEQFFDKDNISHLKHSAAKKLLTVRSLGPPTNKNTSQLGLTPRAASLLTPSSSTTTPGFVPPPQLTSSSLLSSWSEINTPHSPASPYVQARILDHIQREETLAQIHLATWAGELQRRLHAERLRFEGVAQREQRAWLAEKMEACPKSGEGRGGGGGGGGGGEGLDGFQGDGAKEQGNAATPRSRRRKAAPTLAGMAGTTVDPGDPLGLIRWQQRIRRGGWMALRIVGGLGIIGAVAVWAWNAWRGELERGVWVPVGGAGRWMPQQQTGASWGRGFAG